MRFRGVVATLGALGLSLALQGASLADTLPSCDKVRGDYAKLAGQTDKGTSFLIFLGRMGFRSGVVECFGSERKIKASKGRHRVR